MTMKVPHNIMDDWNECCDKSTEKMFPQKSREEISESLRQSEWLQNKRWKDVLKMFLEKHTENKTIDDVIMEFIKHVNIVNDMSEEELVSELKEIIENQKKENSCNISR